MRFAPYGLLLLALLSTLLPAEAPAADEYDLVIYGGTSGGVAAAVQTARMGRTAIVIEPSRHVGGLTSGGLGATDIGNKAAIGGVSREFYRRVKQHYERDEAWVHEAKGSYRSRRQRPGEDTMWTFEPKVAEALFRDMLREAKVEVLLGQRLDRKGGVEKRGGRITSIRMESGRTFQGRMFIDATYEGDLLAAAGVSFHVGREANATYGETLNGVQTKNAVKHQFIKRVDPYVTPGDAESGLLPGVHAGPPGAEGAGDHRVQAYNYRLCATDVPENRRPWPQPKGYDPLRYELLLRNFEAGDHRVPWNPILMPNRKTDSNNNFAISTDNIGMNYAYPEADYQARERIVREHVTYQQGLMWTLANSPRVPEQVRRHFQTWGLAKDEFTDNDNWPHQLYVREARRMVGATVMTQHHCQGREVVDDPVGLAAYTMDSHNVQRYVRDGAAINEGDVQVGGFPPYPVSYRAIIPQADECPNLLVPVCLSASHIAYGSIRMEPVFMVLGQSAATAACQAIAADVSVQQLDYAALRKQLLEDEQVLEWTGPRPHVGLDPAKLPGVVVDDAAAKLTGTWLTSRSVGGFVGSGYRHDNNEDKGQRTAQFMPRLPEAGRYEIRVAYAPHSNRAGKVRVVVVHADGRAAATLDQRRKPPIDGVFQSLGTFPFAKGEAGYVLISNEGTDGFVVIDAVQFLPK